LPAGITKLEIAWITITFALLTWGQALKIGNELIAFQLVHQVLIFFKDFKSFEF
jgi:hypothetical protein